MVRSNVCFSEASDSILYRYRYRTAFWTVSLSDSVGQHRTVSDSIGQYRHARRICNRLGPRVSTLYPQVIHSLSHIATLCVRQVAHDSEADEGPAEVFGVHRLRLAPGTKSGYMGWRSRFSCCVQ